MSKKQEPNITNNEDKKDKMYTYYITFNYQTPEGHTAIGSMPIQASTKIEYWSDIKFLHEEVKKNIKNFKSIMILSWVLLKGMDRNKNPAKKVKRVAKEPKKK